MGKRSLKSSPEGQITAKRAFERTHWTQEQLAYEVGLNTRQSVWKFFSGRPVERHVFMELCFRLDLDWKDIVESPSVDKVPITEFIPPSSIPSNHNSETKTDKDNWVQILREYLKPAIAQKCGFLQSSLDVGQPIPLEKLYTPLQIVPHLKHQQWLELRDLQPSGGKRSPELIETQRVQLTQDHSASVDAMEIVQQTPKLMLLGKPGSGKTTFLQYLAGQCTSGQYQAERIPVFITLRYGLSSVANSELFQTYLGELFKGTKLPEEELNSLLQQGKFLLLLDGLDEVPQEEYQGILVGLQGFTARYPNNHVIITSRLTSKGFYLPGFNTAEVDDLSQSQILFFVRAWFNANLPNPEQAELKTKSFTGALDSSENLPLKDLTSTPILLSLLCSVFLTRSTFPRQRAKLYKAGLDILLKRWDQARGIQRKSTYHNLSTTEKVRLLSNIAATTFEQGHYFFEKSELLDLIAEYISKLDKNSDSPDWEDLYQQSETIIQEIQVQNGLIVERAKEIYSFSHLTFQEYLTARKILYQSTPEQLKAKIIDLAKHTLDPNWHEVLSLTSNMMTDADSLLRAMQDEVQQSLESQSEIKDCLREINQKISSLSSSCKPATLRAFYLTLFGDRDLRLATALDGDIAGKLEQDLDLDLSLARAFEAGCVLLEDPSIKQMLNLIFALQLDQKLSLDEELQTAFKNIKEKLPSIEMEESALRQWWQESGTQWLDEFQKLLLKHRHIGQAQQLTLQQRESLHQYYLLNLFLIDCWKESETSNQYTNFMMESLLLPYEEYAEAFAAIN